MRDSWENYFMKIATLVASRSTCNRAWVGAVIVNKDNRIVSTGYNGSVSGAPHCDDIGHTMVDGHCVATVHAEQNALYYCAKEGIATKGCSIYVTHYPCLICTKAIIQAGIVEVFYKEAYRVDEYAKSLLEKANIRVTKID